MTLGFRLLLNRRKPAFLLGPIPSYLQKRTFVVFLFLFCFVSNFVTLVALAEVWALLGVILVLTISKLERLFQQCSDIKSFLCLLLTLLSPHCLYYNTIFYYRRPARWKDFLLVACHCIVYILY